APRGASLDEGVEFGEARPQAPTTNGNREDREVVSQPKLLWTFRLPERGSIVASPLVVGERVYVAAAHANVFRRYGAVYCLKRDSGEVVWAFSDRKKMKQVASSPSFADGKIYIGEGFHDDSNCRVFCLSADTGDKEWEFATGSHTESAPVVVGGLIYFG